jgi:hypothetical protein
MPRSCWRSLRHRSKQRAWRSVRHARPERARSLTSRRRATQSPLKCSTWPLSSSPMLVKLRRSRAAGEGGQSTLEPRPARASCRRCCRGHDRTLRRRVSRRTRGAPRLHAPAPRPSRSCAARCDAPLRPPHPASARRLRPNWAERSLDADHIRLLDRGPLAACRIWGCDAHMMATTLCGAVQSFTMRPPPTPFRRLLRNDRANSTGC